MKSIIFFLLIFFNTMLNLSLAEDGFIDCNKNFHSLGAEGDFLTFQKNYSQIIEKINSEFSHPVCGDTAKINIYSCKLFTAIDDCNLARVKKVLEYASVANFNILNFRGSYVKFDTPLSRAILKDSKTTRCEEVTNYLLNIEGIDLNFKIQVGNESFGFAQYYFHKNTTSYINQRIFKLMKTKFGNLWPSIINEQDSHGNTILSKSLNSDLWLHNPRVGYNYIFNLLNLEASPNVINNNGENAMFQLTKFTKWSPSNLESIFNLLDLNDADYDRPNKNNTTSYDMLLRNYTGTEFNSVRAIIEKKLNGISNKNCKQPIINYAKDCFPLKAAGRCRSNIIINNIESNNFSAKSPNGQNILQFMVSNSSRGGTGICKQALSNVINNNTYLKKTGLINDKDNNGDNLLNHMLRKEIAISSVLEFNDPAPDVNVMNIDGRHAGHLIAKTLDRYDRNTYKSIYGKIKYIDQQDNQGYSPLMIAASTGSVGQLKVLLNDFGADPRCLGNRHETAMSLAEGLPDNNPNKKIIKDELRRAMNSVTSSPFCRTK